MSSLQKTDTALVRNHWMWMKKSKNWSLYRNKEPFLINVSYKPVTTLWEKADAIGMAKNDFMEYHDYVSGTFACGSIKEWSIGSWICGSSTFDHIIKERYSGFYGDGCYDAITDRLDKDEADPLMVGIGYEIFMEKSLKPTIWFARSNRIENMFHVAEFRLDSNVMHISNRTIPFTFFSDQTDLFVESKKCFKPGDYLVREHICSDGYSSYCVWFKTELNLGKLVFHGIGIAYDQQSEIKERLLQNKNYIDAKWEAFLNSRKVAATDKQKIQQTMDLVDSSEEKDQESVQTPVATEITEPTTSTRKIVDRTGLEIFMMILFIYLTTCFLAIIAFRCNVAIKEEQDIRESRLLSLDKFIELGKQRLEAAEAERELIQELNQTDLEKDSSYLSVNIYRLRKRMDQIIQYNHLLQEIVEKTRANRHISENL